MSYDYGYGELENKLIELLHSCPPNFDEANKLIKQGADVNATGKMPDENVLSEILHGYGRNNETDNHFEAGESMCQIIRFFLSHGFDVNKFNGCYGAQCLFALTLSTEDKYLLEATKILFDAGARNCNTSYDERCDGCTPLDFIGMEGSYQDIC